LILVFILIVSRVLTTNQIEEARLEFQQRKAERQRQLALRALPAEARGRPHSDSNNNPRTDDHHQQSQLTVNSTQTACTVQSASRHVNGQVHKSESKSPQPIETSTLPNISNTDEAANQQSQSEKTQLRRKLQYLSKLSTQSRAQQVRNSYQIFAAPQRFKGYSPLKDKIRSPLSYRYQSPATTTTPRSAKGDSPSHGIQSTTNHQPPPLKPLQQPQSQLTQQQPRRHSHQTQSAALPAFTQTPGPVAIHVMEVYKKPTSNSHQSFPSNSHSQNSAFEEPTAPQHSSLSSTAQQPESEDKAPLIHEDETLSNLPLSLSFLQSLALSVKSDHDILDSSLRVEPPALEILYSEEVAECDLEETGDVFDSEHIAQAESESAIQIHSFYEDDPAEPFSTEVGVAMAKEISIEHFTAEGNVFDNNEGNTATDDTQFEFMTLDEAFERIQADTHAEEDPSEQNDQEEFSDVTREGSNVEKVTEEEDQEDLYTDYYDTQFEESGEENPPTDDNSMIALKSCKPMSNLSTPSNLPSTCGNRQVIEANSDLGTDADVAIEDSLTIAAYPRMPDSLKCESSKPTNSTVPVAISAAIQDLDYDLLFDDDFLSHTLLEPVQLSEVHQQSSAVVEISGLDACYDLDFEQDTYEDDFVDFD
jgi:hypothetical protein